MTVTLGGAGSGPRPRGRSRPSSARRSRGWTWPGVHCAWSSPTAPANARCRFSSRPSKKASAAGPVPALLWSRSARTRRCPRMPSRALVGPSSIPTRNHAWWDDDTFTHVGTLPGELVRELSGGRIHDSIDVRINRLVVESDVTLIVGPVLPHEVIGFSGGNKYLFPGLSGQEMIDVTHWLGALITSSEIIGTRGITPVRALVDAAAELVPGERHALCVVVDHVSGGLESLSFGEPERRVGRRSGRRGRDARRVPRRRRCSRVLSIVPDPLPGPLDRGQGLLQGRAGRRRRRRGRPVCAAHHRDRGHAPSARWRSATTAATSSWPTGTATATSRWASWRTPPTSSEPGPTTGRRASTSASG